ncbi:DNA mismatch repair protein MutL [Rickettsiales bacterium Ac37b]|nr:DNA mismatch repair protein MutL [Rickettsiales bacterium Ac37b]
MKKSIKILSSTTINRIAAGEVIERPASAVKELIENAIDAKATQIDILLQNAGRNLIQITDNGHGMNKEELGIAIERHATSKLEEDDLLNISYFGFRGEALPSIASVSRMTITSRTKDSEHAWRITINGGDKEPTIPASSLVGTIIEVRDLFFATPTRLKFLKSERTELQYIVDIVHKLAIAHINVGFSLSTDKKEIFSLRPSTLLERISVILGEEFANNSLALNTTVENLSIQGYTSLPTFNRNTSSELYLFVNNRPVKDKLIITAAKIAYQDFMPRERYPVLVLFLTIPYDQVDVNVHPTKAEVRFRDSDIIRNIIIKSIKDALSQGSHRTSTTITTKAINSFKPSINAIPSTYINSILKSNDITKNYYAPLESAKKIASVASTPLEVTPSFLDQNSTPTTHAPINKQENSKNTISSESTDITLPIVNLGNAKSQLYSTYIIAEKDTGIVIIDQHAAHERLIYEKLKLSYNQGKILKQRLLVPEILELDTKLIIPLNKARNDLDKLGLTYEICGDNTVMVNEIPLLLGKVNVATLIKDIADELLEYEEDLSLSSAIEHILETFACHHSIRAGRKLSLEEMNAMLREMENTPHSGQCNHGRPTYIELNFKDIEKLFGRS